MGRTCWRILEFSFGGGPEASPLPHHSTTIPSPFLAGFLEGTYQKDMFQIILSQEALSSSHEHALFSCG